MIDTQMNTMKVKLINKSNVYKAIYTLKRTCKHDITAHLNMGLSTVTQNLKILEEQGLICKNGFFNSTGGRKADALEIVADARISVGVSIGKNKVHILSADLYGQLLHKKTVVLSYSKDSNFYADLSKEILDFISTHAYDTQKILGVSIATQGIVSSDGESISYGKILNNADMKLADFQSHLPFPCSMIHDSKAAATLELFKKPEITDAILLLLNHNMGGALITNGQVHNGLNMGSGIIEHMTLNIDGDTCYCGRKGCLETYCSLDVLKQKAGVPHTHLFFEGFRSPSTELETFDTISTHSNSEFQAIWDEYLFNLSKAITSLSLLIDGHYILSGVLAPYFTEKDIDTLIENINEHRLFPLSKDRFVLGEVGRYTQALGAALLYINEFLNTEV